LPTAARTILFRPAKPAMTPIGSRLENTEQMSNTPNTIGAIVTLKMRQEHFF
jgi:hypothetical protein